MDAARLPFTSTTRTCLFFASTRSSSPQRQRQFWSSNTHPFACSNIKA